MHSIAMIAEPNLIKYQMVIKDKIREGIGLPDALPDKMIAEIFLHPVLSVLIWSLFNSQNLLIGGFYEGWGSRFQLWINFSYKFITYSLPRPHSTEPLFHCGYVHRISNSRVDKSFPQRPFF